MVTNNPLFYLTWWDDAWLSVLLALSNGYVDCWWCLLYWCLLNTLKGHFVLFIRTFFLLFTHKKKMLKLKHFYHWHCYYMFVILLHCYYGQVLIYCNNFIGVTVKERDSNSGATLVDVGLVKVWAYML